MIVRYNAWDQVVISVGGTSDDGKPFSSPVSATVIGHNYDPDSPSTEYLCYVPQYETTPASFRITDYHVQWWKADARFLGEQGLFVGHDTRVTKHVPAVPGERCERCQEFVPHAPKTADAYRCRACRENPYR